MRGVVGQRVAVTDSNARGVTIGGCRDRCDRKDTISGRDGLADNGLNACNLDRGDAVNTVHCERAGLRQWLFGGIGAIGQIVFINNQFWPFDVQAVDRNRVVRPIDSYGQRCRARVAITVGNGISKDFGQRVVAIKSLNHRIEVIENI